MEDLLRKLILGQWIMIQLLSPATKGLARQSLSLTVSSAFWKRASLCGLVNGEGEKNTGKMQQDIDSNLLLLTVLFYFILVLVFYFFNFKIFNSYMSSQT